ncbi:MAG: ABC transporter substrate-binding protein [Deltaproteobacteria bacterium]|nr:ABC transporter substrate-binding protein [Deltaproteobacteria bacterium]
MKKTTFVIGILLVLFLLVPATAGAKDKVRGVTDTEIVIGMTTPLTGPAALWGVTAHGAKAWADHVNDQGGIHGRKIKCIIMDDGYNPARALTNLQQMKNKVFAVVGLLGTAVLHTTRDFFAENKMPMIMGYGNTRMFKDYPKDKLHYLFLTYPDYEDEAEWIIKYAYRNLNGRKIAVFYQNDDYGKLGLVGVKKAVKALPGAKLVAAIPYEVSERSLGAHALKLKEAGADTLYSLATPTHGALIMKEMAKVGFRPTTLTSFPIGDPIMFKLAGELWEGVYPAQVAHADIPFFDSTADRVIGIVLKYNPKLAGIENLAIFGSISMMHLVEGLKRAGRDLTVEKLITAMESIKDWKPEGMGAPVTYGPDRHQGLNGIRLSRAEKGRVKPITSYIVFKSHF